MASASPATSNTLQCVEWMWKSNEDPWSKKEPEQWSHYSDVQNLIIEEAFSKNEPTAIFDNYYIDLKDNVQISNTDSYKQRPVKRMVRKREDKHLREERFVDAPVASKRPVGGEYGWVSPFIIEVRRHLKLRRIDLPSKNEALVPELVEKAAQGIIEESGYIGKKHEGEKIAKMLREKKNQGVKKVWRCCAYLYSLESFLYKKLNEAMRLVGDQEHEQVWREKVRTLGPFGLLLWDNPFNKKVEINKMLYRGAMLSDEQVDYYKKMAENKDEYRSFQAFTSCSRNRQKAMEFGNVLFIMEVLFAFIADISKLSEYQEEEEELITPGVCFAVAKVEYDEKEKKHLIHLKLRQRFSTNDYTDIRRSNTNNEEADEYDADARDLYGDDADDARDDADDAGYDAAGLYGYYDAAGLYGGRYGYGRFDRDGKLS